MRNFVIASLLFGLTAVTGAVSAQAADRVSVPVSGLRSDDGVVRCGLYAGAEAFPKAGQESRGVIAKIKGGQATCVFNGLKPGTYAVAAFHAENNETQMQYGMFGKPKEGYGFSPIRPRIWARRPSRQPPSTIRAAPSRSRSGSHTEPRLPPSPKLTCLGSDSRDPIPSSLSFMPQGARKAGVSKDDPARAPGAGPVPSRRAAFGAAP